jgi:hypothetical protein
MEAAAAACARDIVVLPKGRTIAWRHPTGVRVQRQLPNNSAPQAFACQRATLKKSAMIVWKKHGAAAGFLPISA